MLKRRSNKHGKFQTPTLLAGAVLLLLVFVSAGFLLTLSQDEPTHTRKLRDTDKQTMARWQLERPAGFRYLVQRRCECDARLQRPYRVTETGQSWHAEFLVAPQAGDQLPPNPETSGDIIELALLADELGTLTSARLDPVWGYVAFLQIDDGAASSFEILDFELIANDD